MGLSPHDNDRSELNESMREGTIDIGDTVCSIMKDELIISDDSDFIDVCIRDKDSCDSLNNTGEIINITIDSDGANAVQESFVGICDSDAKKTTSNNNSTIDHVYNDKKISEFSQCEITTNKLMNQSNLCKAKKSLKCSACSLKCSSKNNLEHHMQNDHKISTNCAVTSKLKEKEMSKSMNHSSNERSAQNSSKINRKKNIELYCAKCDSISIPTILSKREICELCNICLFYQCKLCKKRYTCRESIYAHLKNECINIEPQYICSQCDYKAKRKAALQIHVKLKHSIRKCTVCGKNFKDSFALKKHKMHKCLNKPMFKCNCCSYKAIFKTRLEKHIRLEHNSRYTCSQCGKKYIRLISFINHQKYDCGSEIRYECNHCSYSTIRKADLKVHLKSQHSEIFLFGDLS